MVGTGGQGVARLPTICAEPRLITALALLKGERPSVRVAAICQMYINQVLSFSRRCAQQGKDSIKYLTGLSLDGGILGGFLYGSLS